MDAHRYVIPTALHRLEGLPQDRHMFTLAFQLDCGSQAPGYPSFPQLECLRLDSAGWQCPIWEDALQGPTSSLADTSLPEVIHPLR